MAEKKPTTGRVKRQQKPNECAHWEQFARCWRPHRNVILCLRDIAENPITRDGQKIRPIAYESNCLEGACGSCAMVINRKALMACSTLVDSRDQELCM